MRILFLSAWYPCPPDNGSKIRVFNLLRQLSARHEITLFSFVDPEDRPEEGSPLNSLCREVRTFPRPVHRPGTLSSLVGLATPTPRHLSATFSRALAQAVRAEVRGKHYDVLVASQRRMALYAAPISGLPKVWEEVETTVIGEAHRRERSTPRRLRRRITWLKERAYIRRMARHFDACTVVSQDEERRLKAIAPHVARLTVVPNGVDLDHYRPLDISALADTLVFNGSLTYRPNYDAMRYFLQDIYPLIKARRPGVQLVITGHTDGLDLSPLLAHDGVSLSGHLADIRPVVARSWARVVPLRIGGGTRLKILEAMALRTPVVATRKGAEGLQVRHASDILLAEDAPSFARQVVSVLEDEGLRRRLATAGRQTVEQLYGWDGIGNRLDALLREVVREVRP